MKKIIFASIFTLFAVVTAIGQMQQGEIDYRKALLVDVRTPQEFAEGTAKGAINIPLQEIQSRINEFKTDKPIVVFCRSGARSARAEQILKQNGITNVINGGTWLDVDRKVKGQK
ncbi:MAG: rhodanese-like domain-containing protein [Thermaurantimonas sp.]|uniref:rhodanese-like domain-containing protein n=1 Tax=Thermaurantimonas TaxID=2681566 RepID=UPI0023F176EA|nr:rhodanese-like domain-containing protein [Thermaurantimonas aggregans]MCX8147654.1 rhodanese-like domain-containing protein [Thermaurantimonas aggregans]